MHEEWEEREEPNKLGNNKRPDHDHALTLQTMATMYAYIRLSASNESHLYLNC